MRRFSFVLAVLTVALVAACGNGTRALDEQAGTATAPAARDEAVEASAVAADSDLELVIAPTLRGRIDEALVREAFRRAVAQGERDFGLRPERTVTVYVDPDSALGLEEALGLSSRTAIHLRAGRAGRMESLLPLMMHEYMHVLQYSAGRLRPQWWIEGQAEHQAGRVLDPSRAARERSTLLRSLASDVRGNRAPALADLRGSTGWDAYLKRAGAAKAYGWGHAAVAFIEEGWGFPAVSRLVREAEGPNSLNSFDAAILRETGLGPAEFDAGLKAWVAKQG